MGPEDKSEFFSKSSLELKESEHPIGLVTKSEALIQVCLSKSWDECPQHIFLGTLLTSPSTQAGCSFWS